MAAAFVCDGCGKSLCEDCTQRSHALFLCRHCGERALPLAGAGPTTVRQHERRARQRGSYSIPQAFFYPFRGLGLYLFLATLISMALLELLMTVAISCLPLVIALGFWSLMIGLQFKIVSSTAAGDDELPDWPSYFSFWERFRDILAYLAIAVLQFGPLVAYVSVLGPDRLLAGEPSLGYWIGFAIAGWVGAALALVAFGAAGRFGVGAAVRLDLHARAFLAAGRDALVLTDVVFVIGVAFWVARALLQGVPWVGAAVAGVLGAYWLFTSAHFAGLLVRRHEPEFEAIYD